MKLSKILETKLNFKNTLKYILSNAKKTMGLLRRLKSILHRASLLTIFKSFVRLQLDYGVFTYD